MRLRASMRANVPSVRNPPKVAAVARGAVRVVDIDALLAPEYRIGGSSSDDRNQ